MYRIAMAVGLLGLGVALAGACDDPKNLPKQLYTKTEVDQFGEFCLGFDLKGQQQMEYHVTGLSVPLGPGQELRPTDRDQTPLDILDKPVTLQIGKITPATIPYEYTRVAYLRVNFEVSVQNGTLTRTQKGESRVVAEVRPGTAVSLAWGLAWVLTFGLVGVFAWPNATQTVTLDETVPINSPPITYSVGGGGGCLAFSGAWDRITFSPAQARAGQLYTLKVGLRCGGLFQGNQAFVGQVAPDLIGLRWERDGVWQNSRYRAGGEYGDPNYPFSFLLPYGTPIYWEVPTPGYYAHAVAIDTGVFNTKTAPVQTNVSVPYRLRSLTSRRFRDPDGDSTTLYTGEVAFPLPDHPLLGPVAVQETYTDSETPTGVTLLRLLPGSDPVEGTKNFTLGDFSLGVNSVTYQAQTQSQNGSTVIRSVPVYNLNPPATHDLVIRTRSAAGCTWTAPKSYDCGSYGRFKDGTWQ